MATTSRSRAETIDPLLQMAPYDCCCRAAGVVRPRLQPGLSVPSLEDLLSSGAPSGQAGSPQSSYKVDFGAAIIGKAVSSMYG